MGADRYSVCPRCQSRKDRQVISNNGRLQEAYGKLPLEEFDALRDEVEHFEAEPVPQALREDYEFEPPVDDGVLVIRYKAFCGDCELSFTIEEDRALWTSEEIES